MSKHFLSINLSCLLLTLVCFGTVRGQGSAPPERPLVIPDDAPQQKVVVLKAGVVGDYNLIPNDYWTHGTMEDILLSNGTAGAVFGHIPEDEKDQNPFRQGSLLDLFTSPSSTESFQVFQPTTIATGAGRSILHSDLATEVDQDSESVFVTAFGKDAYRKSVEVDTRYEMKAIWPGVLATTTLTNRSEEDVTLPVMGDYVGWGFMIPFTSGSGWTKESGIVQDCEFVYARSFDSYIMIMPVEGLFDFKKNASYSTFIYDENVKLGPGESRSYQRWILTGEDDPSKLYSFVLKEKMPGEHGFLAGRVEEEVFVKGYETKTTKYVEGAEVRIEVIKRDDLPKEYRYKPYMIAVTDKNGEYRVALPPGEYAARAYTPSRISQQNRVGRKVIANSITPAMLTVSEASKVQFEIRDSGSGELIPGKVSFVPLRGTTTPDFGPPGSLASGNVVYTKSGSGQIEVPKGNYRVVASHGNEYHTDEKRLRLNEAEVSKVVFELDRAFETPGWISADIGVMTDRSPHSRVSPADRIATAMAEGLDWIVTTDTNTVTDLQPVIDSLGLQGEIRASPGIRITPTLEKDRGEYILFPLDMCAGDISFEIESLLELKSAESMISALNDICPEGVLVASRAIFPEVGLMGALGYDFQQGIAPEEIAFDPEVDAFQIVEGKRQFLATPSLQSWYHLLANDYWMTPVANSLSAGTIQEEPGYPRLYIRSENDNPSQLDPAELADAIIEGRVQITNGPFMDLKVNGEEIGSIITDTDGEIDIELQVFSPNWANVADVAINTNGFFARKFILPAGSYDPKAERVYPAPDEDEKMSFNLTIREDTILVVELRGDPALPQDPVNPFVLPDFTQRGNNGQRTFALNAPIYIDFDGDGLVTPPLAEFKTLKSREETEEESATPF